MIPETKIYSDFIKRNRIKVTHYGFICKGEEILLSRSDEGRKLWYADVLGDGCYTKKEAIYYHFQNHCNVKNGVII